MSLEEFLALKPDHMYFENLLHIKGAEVFGFVCLFLLVGFLLMGVFARFSSLDEISNLIRTAVISSVLSFCILVVFFPYFIQMRLHDDWKEIGATEYLENLEPYTSDINDLDIKNLNGSKLTIGYDNRVTFSHEGDMVYESNAAIKLDLESGEKSYVSYVLVPEEIVEWYHNPFENVQIHFPKDHKFD